MSDEQRRHISNLLLLCDPHHRLVDKYEQVYPPKTLCRWKTQRETDLRQALQRLREVSPDGLRRIVADGLKDHDAKLALALNRLQERGAEAAGLMRGLIDELTKAYTWQRRRSPDPAMVSEFSSAVGKLTRMTKTLDAFIEAMHSYWRLPGEFRA